MYQMAECLVEALFIYEYIITWWYFLIDCYVSNKLYTRWQIRTFFILLWNGVIFSQPSDFYLKSIVHNVHCSSQYLYAIENSVAF